VVFVHVIEKAGGAVDKAGVEQREEYAAEIFAVVEDAAADAGVPVETDLRFDTDVADAIFAAGRDHDASAIAFTPRDGSVVRPPHRRPRPRPRETGRPPGRRAPGGGRG